MTEKTISANFTRLGEQGWIYGDLKTSNRKRFLQKPSLLVLQL